MTCFTVNSHYCVDLRVQAENKKIPRALFWSGLTQGTICRPFFGRPIPFSHAPRAFYPPPLAAPGWIPLFGLFLLAWQKYHLELEFFADFHIFCRELPHVSREVSRFEIGRFKKKLWSSEDTSFSRFLSVHTWEEPFHIIVWKPG